MLREGGHSAITCGAGKEGAKSMDKLMEQMQILKIQYGSTMMRDSNISRLQRGSTERILSEKIICTYMLDAAVSIHELRSDERGRPLFEGWMSENELHRAFAISLCGILFDKIPVFLNAFPDEFALLIHLTRRRWQNSEQLLRDVMSKLTQLMAGIRL